MSDVEISSSELRVLLIEQFQEFLGADVQFRIIRDELHERSSHLTIVCPHLLSAWSLKANRSWPGQDWQVRVATLIGLSGPTEVEDEQIEIEIQEKHPILFSSQKDEIGELQDELREELEVSLAQKRVSKLNESFKSPNGVRYVAQSLNEDCFNRGHWAWWFTAELESSTPTVTSILRGSREALGQFREMADRFGWPLSLGFFNFVIREGFPTENR
jgi:hypothetical protein